MASKDFSVEAATASAMSELGSISSEKHHPAKLLMAEAGVWFTNKLLQVATADLIGWG